MRTLRSEDFHIGSAPAAEPSARVGRPGYAWRAWHECHALIGQLRRLFGPEPPGCRLYVKQNPHDFGAYLSVNISLPRGDERGTAYALRCEDGLPNKWDAEARAELGLDAPPAEPTAPAGAKAGRPRTTKKGGGR